MSERAGDEQLQFSPQESLFARKPVSAYALLTAGFGAGWFSGIAWLKSGISAPVHKTRPTPRIRVNLPDQTTVQSFKPAVGLQPRS